MKRFWEKVNKTDGCWLWVGGRGLKGYGRMMVFGRRSFVHRLSWELHNGPIPKDFWDTVNRIRKGKNWKHLLSEVSL